MPLFYHREPLQPPHKVRMSHKREPVPPLVITRFGGQSPNGCESHLGASGPSANQKGSHVPLISAIVKVSSPPT